MLTNEPISPPRTSVSLSSSSSAQLPHPTSTAHLHSRNSCWSQSDGAGSGQPHSLVTAQRIEPLARPPFSSALLLRSSVLLLFSSALLLRSSVLLLSSSASPQGCLRACSEGTRPWRPSALAAPDRQTDLRIPCRSTTNGPLLMVWLTTAPS